MVELREGSAVLHLLRRRDGARDQPAPGDTPREGDRPAQRSSGGRPAPTVTCSFCGQDFVEDRSQATCQACPLSQACGLMRCPHCGYENPKQPAWIGKLKEWIR